MQKSNVILPPKTIGIIGGGQLGRMMTISAKYMGYTVVVLDPAKNCPTAQVADEHIVAAYDDMQAIKQLTAKADVVTYEFENVDLEAAAYIEQQGKLPQGAYALQITQNRAEEKRVIKENNLPVPPFSIVHSGKECENALESIPFPAVIKTCRGGYDGKGQLKISTAEDVQAAILFAEEKHPCIVEHWISFDKEISVVFSRAQTGEITFFPIAQNEHKDHILFETTVPASISKAVHDKALEAATVLAKKINVVGTFAIEMFVKDEQIYINEMAPRPHNSGHYTIEACNVSQFTQHIRAICGLPLVQIALLQPAIMTNILGENMNQVLHALQRSSEGFVHLYGKDEAKVKRKMGHVTFIGHSEKAVLQQANRFKEEMR
ncbi:5-(carboxyamino)imidazole ribonucleotide synthase [Virgibacillus sp. W0430]|uniref:5-(carboxyamino)imidazole ribonucleotide synthase n=1 Tax=Virgibacillus sp. W0430 TaxID=3391580 RepID=UPI003F48F134